MSMVNGKQWRYLDSSDRAWRQLINDEIVAETQLLGTAERWHWSGRPKFPKSLCSQHAACWRIAADAAVGFIVPCVVVVVVVGDDGKWSIRYRWSVCRARHQMLSTAAVGSAAADQCRAHLATVRWHGLPAVCTNDKQQRQLACIVLSLDCRSIAGWITTPTSRHFGLIPPTDISEIVCVAQLPHLMVYKIRDQQPKLASV